MNRNNHVADGVHFAGIWVSGTVVEKVDDILGSFLGAFEFGSGKIIESVHHGVVQCLCNVEELVGDLFKVFGLSKRERQGGVNCGELLLGTVLRGLEFGRDIEVVGWELILELQEGLLYETVHGDDMSMFCVVLFEINAVRSSAMPVRLHWVVVTD